MNIAGRLLLLAATIGLVSFVLYAAAYARASHFCAFDKVNASTNPTNNIRDDGTYFISDYFSPQSTIQSPESLVDNRIAYDINRHEDVYVANFKQFYKLATSVCVHNHFSIR